LVLKVKYTTLIGLATLWSRCMNHVWLFQYMEWSRICI
jgi:hypothetical protein